MALITAGSTPLTDGRTLRPLDGGLLSALAPDAEAGAYDRHAKLYDRLVGARLYNRVIWGADVADYAAFAREAAQAGDGPLLDAGCGTAHFTAAAYREADRPLTLVDRSRGMLRRAAERLADARPPVTLIEADLLDLPFAPGSFTTVCSHAVLHVLDDPWAALAALRAQVAPGGTLFVSMLVSGRGSVSEPYLRALHRHGEISAPRTADELRDAAATVLGGHDGVTVHRRGAMAYLRATVPATDR